MNQAEKDDFLTRMTSTQMTENNNHVSTIFLQV